MNSPPSPESRPLSIDEERRLQQLFRDGGADYIDDAGFTVQVLGRLRVPGRQREWRRRLLVGGAVLAGGAAAVLGGGHQLAAALSAGWMLLGDWSARPIPGLETMATIGSAVVLVGALGVAWWSYLRES